MFNRLMMVALVFALAMPCSAISARAADFVFKYANTQSENHPRSKSMVYFKEQLEKRSGGRIKVELYFSGTLGKESETLEMVKLGNLQGSHDGLFERANKKFLMYTLPFMFANADQVVKVMNSDLGREINEGALMNGFYIPATGVAGGMRQPTNKVRPIKSVADLKGLKLRTPPIDVTIRTFKELGANPQQVPYTETYMALKTGVVDGQENPFSNCVDMKFYEVQKYLSVLNWQVHPDPFYVNPAWYEKLPADLQKVFDEVAVETMNHSNKIWLASEDGYYETLKGKLEVNVLDDAAYQEFVKAVKPVWQYYVDQGAFSWDDIKRAQTIAQ
jgi:C4-dicarboxylate-binding protein DctP